MNLKISLLTLAVFVCYASADLVAPASKAEKTDTKKKDVPHLLSADAGTTNFSASSVEPSTVSPTVPPTVAPDFKGDWMVNHTASTAICIRLVAEIKLKVGYVKANNETGETEVQVPKTAKASGNCTTGTMELLWPSTSGTKKNDSLSFFFTLDNATQIWRVLNISGLVTLQIPAKTAKTHNNVSLAFSNNNTSIFNAHVGMSYLCLRDDSFDLSVNKTTQASNINITTAAVTFSQFQLEAYKPNNTNNLVFGSPNNCEVTPDMVPIAVGCALAGLVVIVLVAYLIAQRKPPAQGYRSV